MKLASEYIPEVAARNKFVHHEVASVPKNSGELELDKLFDKTLKTSPSISTRSSVE
jgi:hypothetical protein